MSENEESRQSGSSTQKSRRPEESPDLMPSYVMLNVGKRGFGKREYDYVKKNFITNQRGYVIGISEIKLSEVWEKAAKKEMAEDGIEVYHVKSREAVAKKKNTDSGKSAAKKKNPDSEEADAKQKNPDSEEAAAEKENPDSQEGYCVTEKRSYHDGLFVLVDKMLKPQCLKASKSGGIDWNYLTFAISGHKDSEEKRIYCFFGYRHSQKAAKKKAALFVDGPLQEFLNCTEAEGKEKVVFGDFNIPRRVYGGELVYGYSLSGNIAELFFKKLHKQEKPIVDTIFAPTKHHGDNAPDYFGMTDYLNYGMAEVRDFYIEGFSAFASDHRIICQRPRENVQNELNRRIPGHYEYTKPSFLIKCRYTSCPYEGAVKDILDHERTGHKTDSMWKHAAFACTDDNCDVKFKLYPHQPKLTWHKQHHFKQIAGIPQVCCDKCHHYFYTDHRNQCKGPYHIDLETDSSRDETDNNSDKKEVDAEHQDDDDDPEAGEN